MFEDWAYEGDGLIYQKDVEKKIELDIKPFLDALRIPVKRILETVSKTSDYEGGGVDFEVTAVQVYLPSSIVDELESYSKQFGRCQYFYAFSDSQMRANLVKLTEIECMSTGLALCVRQHISLYFKKIMRKIEVKYNQNTTNPHQVIVLDFRGAEFDTLSLKKAIEKILNKVGYKYPKLLGILAALPIAPNSPIMNQQWYIFIQNYYSASTNGEVLNKLLTLKTPTQNFIAPMPILIKKLSSEEFSIDNPLSSMPDLKDISIHGHTTWPYSLDTSGKWQLSQ